MHMLQDLNKSVCYEEASQNRNAVASGSHNPPIWLVMDPTLPRFGSDLPITREASNRLPVRWVLRPCQVHLLRIVLEALDLFCCVEQERSVAFVHRSRSLSAQPVLELVKL